MTRSWSLPVVLVAALAGIGRAQAKQAAPPHVVFFLADDLGWKDVGYHGSEIATPHIDALAREGTRLEQFYVQPVCSPTRAALVTGRYPIRTGLQVGVIRPWASHGLPLEERTLAEALGAAGYETAICGKWHLGLARPELLPTRRGFDHQYGHYCGAIDYFTHARLGGKDWNRDDRPLDEEGYTTELIAKECVRLIEQHDPKKPLFLYVPFNAPHGPLEAPQRYLDRYAGIGRPRRRRFAAMVTCLDDAVGTVVAALAKHGMRKDTLIFFCSDNGGAPSADNGRLRGRKGSLYEGGVRVPALACWPGRVPAGAVVEAPLHIVDVFPTLVRLAGGTTEGSKPLDGKDAWETIAHGAPSPHEEILLNVNPFTGAIRAGDWKLVRNGRRRRRNARRGPATLELFDLAEDPYEQHDLSRTEPDKVAELERRLDRYRREAAPPQPSRPRPPAGFEAPRRWGHADAAAQKPGPKKAGKK